MAYENIDGKISRLYVNRDACNIRMDSHGDRYFKLKPEHSNYSAIYALLLSASMNRYNVRLRLENYEPPNPPSSDILYVVLDYPQT